MRTCLGGIPFDWRQISERRSLGKSATAKNADLQKAERELIKVKEELPESGEPYKSMLYKWLEFAKNAMTGAILGHELAEAATNLWRLLGI
jgi:hypothetical protein